MSPSSSSLTTTVKRWQVPTAKGPRDPFPAQMLGLGKKRLKMYEHFMTFHNISQHFHNIWRSCDIVTESLIDLFPQVFEAPELNVHVEFLGKKSQWKNNETNHGKFGHFGYGKFGRFVKHLLNSIDIYSNCIYYKFIWFVYILIDMFTRDHSLLQHVDNCCVQNDSHRTVDQHV